MARPREETTHDPHVHDESQPGPSRPSSTIAVTDSPVEDALESPPSITGVVRHTPPPHPFYSLPSELILDIVDLLPPDAFVNFAFANYPLLHAYGLAPALSRPRVVYITTQTTIPALFPLLRIPAEIMLHIMRSLKPIDIMRFVVANYQDLSRQGIAPPLTEVMVRRLRNAVSARLAPTILGSSGDPGLSKSDDDAGRRFD